MLACYVLREGGNGLQEGSLLCRADTTADDYNSKVLSERGGADQRVGYTKTGLRASPNRITQNHSLYV